jgi:hypothetical protein
MGEEKKVTRRDFLKFTAVNVPVTLAGITLVSIVANSLICSNEAEAQSGQFKEACIEDCTGCTISCTGGCTDRCQKDCTSCKHGCIVSCTSGCISNIGSTIGCGRCQVCTEKGTAYR